MKEKIQKMNQKIKENNNKKIRKIKKIIFRSK